MLSFYFDFDFVLFCVVRVHFYTVGAAGKAIRTSGFAQEESWKISAKSGMGKALITMFTGSFTSGYFPFTGSFSPVYKWNCSFLILFLFLWSK